MVYIFLLLISLVCFVFLVKEIRKNIASNKRKKEILKSIKRQIEKMKE